MWTAAELGGMRPGGLCQTALSAFVSPAFTNPIDSPLAFFLPSLPMCPHFTDASAKAHLHLPPPPLLPRTPRLRARSPSYCCCSECLCTSRPPPHPFPPPLPPLLLSFPGCRSRGPGHIPAATAQAARAPPDTPPEAAGKPSAEGGGKADQIKVRGLVADGVDFAS